MSPRNLLLGAIAIALLAGLAWMMVPQSPPANEPPPQDRAGQGSDRTKTQQPSSPAIDPGAKGDAASETGDSSAKVAAGEGERSKAPAKEDDIPFREWLHRNDSHVEPPPLLKDWNNPLAVLVLSGEMHGYVEPCGCSANQLGGLARRADLMRQISERGWPMTALDVGGLLNLPTKRQSKIKLEMALASLKQLNYSGVALGVEELRTGLELLRFTDDDRPPFLSCNLVLFGDPMLGIHSPSRTIKIGDVKIGIAAVFGESFKAEVVPTGNAANAQPPDVQILDPVQSLTKALADLEAQKPDLLVLLSHARLDESRALAEKFPQVDLLVSAGGSEDPDPRPKFTGRTLVVSPGQKGKHVAVVGLFPPDQEQAGSARNLKLEVVALDGQRFEDAPSMIDQMRRYQEMLAVQDLVAGEPAVEDPRNAQIEVDNDYVGAQVCGECHKKAYSKWLTTRHAHATESIKIGRPERKAEFISRINDPECIACHVTGWSPQDPYYRYKSGFESESRTPHLLGQQCENCHGPGGRHTALERQFQKDGNVTDELNQFREFVQIFVDEAGAKVCVKCHDGDNDPHFKTDGAVYARFWEEIAHPWRD